MTSSRTSSSRSTPAWSRWWSTTSARTRSTVLHLQLGSAEITVDSRPSDAIALALRVGASIFVDEEVVLKAKNVEATKERDLGMGLAEDQTTIKNWLDSIKPGDFGKIERGKEPGQDEEPRR